MSGKVQNLVQPPISDEALCEDLERYRALCEIVSEAVALHEEGKILDVNNAFCRMFGYELDEVIGLSIYEFSPPELREDYRQLAEATVEDPNQILGLKKDGTIFPIEVSAKTVRLKGKEIRVAVVRDMTFQKQAEEALRESEKKYRLLMEQAPDGIFIRNDEGYFIDVNEKACELTGYTKEELLSIKLADLLPVARLPEFVEVEEDLSEGITLRVERQIERKDGSLLDVGLSVRRIDDKVTQAILRDISERKRAEREIEKSRRDYEHLLNSIEGVVWEAELNPPRYTFISKQAERITGYPAEKWLEDIKFWRTHIHPEDKEKIFGEINKVIMHHRAVGVEYRIIAADGRTVWIRGRISAEVENGVAVKLRGVMVDTTERRLAENELRKMHRMLLDSQQIAHWGSFEWELDENSKITGENIWSDELYRIYGLEPQEKKITYQDFLSFVHPDDRESVYQAMMTTLNERKPFLSQGRIIRPDGEVRYLITQGSVIKDKNGKPVRIVGASSDVTEQKLAEEALHSSELRYRAFIENSSEGISRYDVEPPMPIDWPQKEQVEYLMKHGIMRECNEASARMQGFNSVDEILGLSLGEIVKHRGEENYEALRFFVHSNYRVADAETKTVTKDKKIRYFLVNFMGIVEDGKLVRGWGTQREITKRKHAELKLEAYSEQLRALSARVHAAREEESAHIAREIHDELGTALTGLKWDLEWIDRRLNDSSDIETAKAVQERIHATNRLIDNTIQTVRRISSELRPKLLDDLGLVSAIDWYATQFERRTGVNCKVDSQIEDIELSKEKATATFRIFQEILTNVMRHSEADTVKVYVDTDEDDFVLIVQDNGKGITEKETQNTRSLGLLGMRERAYLVGGKVEIFGQEGIGTTVEVRIPM